jgi:hypothetical protein
MDKMIIAGVALAACVAASGTPVSAAHADAQPLSSKLSYCSVDVVADASARDHSLA